jgi:hypothetical protein
MMHDHQNENVGDNHTGSTGEPTQGDNPGAQGDFGAGQGDPGVSDPIVPEDESEVDDDLEDDDLEDYVDRDPGEDATSVNGGNAER